MGFYPLMIFSQIIIKFPKSDLEIIKKGRKRREELSKKVEAKEEENIAEGKLKIEDPIEQK